MRGLLVLGFVIVVAGSAAAQAPKVSGPVLISPLPPPASALAPAPPPRPEFITSPDWQAKPDGEALAGLYPSYAADKGISGHTIVTCRVRANGTLGDCFVKQEKPRGYGFGRAAIQAARYFKMRPVTVNGAPVEGAIVDLPMTWLLESFQHHSLVVEAAGVTTAPSVDRDWEADYPDAAQANGEEGVVWVRATVGLDGRATAVSVRDSSRSPTLDRAAADAVSDWRFTPALDAAGRPLAATIAVQFEFAPMDFPSKACATLTAHVAWVAKAWPERRIAQFRYYLEGRDYVSTLFHDWKAPGGEAAFDARYAVAFDRALKACATQPDAKFVQVLADAFKASPS